MADAQHSRSSGAEEAGPSGDGADADGNDDARSNSGSCSSRSGSYSQSGSVSNRSGSRYSGSRYSGSRYSESRQGSYRSGAGSYRSGADSDRYSDIGADEFLDFLDDDDDGQLSYRRSVAARPSRAALLRSSNYAAGKRGSVASAAGRRGSVARRASLAASMKRASIADQPIKEEGALPSGFSLPSSIPKPRKEPEAPPKQRMSTLLKGDAAGIEAPPQHQQQRRPRRGSVGGIAAAVSPPRRSQARRRSIVQFAGAGSAALELAEPLEAYVPPAPRPLAGKLAATAAAAGLEDSAAATAAKSDSPARRASQAARQSVASRLSVPGGLTVGARRQSTAVFVTAEELRMREIEAVFPGMKLGAEVWFPTGPRTEEVFTRGTIQGVGQAQALNIEFPDGSVREKHAKDLLLANEVNIVLRKRSAAASAARTLALLLHFLARTRMLPMQ